MYLIIYINLINDIYICIYIQYVYNIYTHIYRHYRFKVILTNNEWIYHISLIHLLERAGLFDQRTCLKIPWGRDKLYCNSECPSNNSTTHGMWATWMIHEIRSGYHPVIHNLSWFQGSLNVHCSLVGAFGMLAVLLRGSGFERHLQRSGPHVFHLGVCVGGHGKAVARWMWIHVIL